MSDTKSAGGGGCRDRRPNHRAAPSFNAPTVGYEHIYFNPTTSATKFNKNNESLSGYLAVSCKHAAAEVTRAP